MIAHWGEIYGMGFNKQISLNSLKESMKLVSNYQREEIYYRDLSNINIPKWDKNTGSSYNNISSFKRIANTNKGARPFYNTVIAVSVIKDTEKIRNKYIDKVINEKKNENSICYLYSQMILNIGKYIYNKKNSSDYRKKNGIKRAIYLHDRILEINTKYYMNSDINEYSQNLLNEIINFSNKRGIYANYRGNIYSTEDKKQA